MRHPSIVDPVPQSAIVEDEQGLSAIGFINFADAQHGWVVLARNLHVGRSSGEMLRTVDGGRTWTQLPKGTLPIAGNFYFANAKDGWTAGGPDQELYVTHDAGSGWQRVDLATPKQISQDLSPVYSLPAFIDRKTAYLTVTYESSTGSGTPLALFKTDDGGSTWHLGVTTPSLPNTHPWTPYPSAITDGELRTATISDGRITLSGAKDGVQPKSQSARMSVHASSADQLSFATPERGWILADYWLLSTTDGGVAWTDVTPEPGGTVPALASPPSALRKIPGSAKAAAMTVASSESSLPASNVSAHLGFDTFPTPPTSAMLAWQNSSPFYDVYIYLYGSPNKSPTKSKYANPAWLSTVEGYGWG